MVLPLCHEVYATEIAALGSGAWLVNTMSLECASRLPTERWPDEFYENGKQRAGVVGRHFQLRDGTD